MKLHILLSTLLLPFFTVGPALLAADTSASAAAPDAQRTLTITVIDPVDRHPENDEYYLRVARIFPEVFEARNWPVKVKAERFGANAPEHDLELRVFLQKIREETQGDLTFRAWIILHDRGTKHDFGIILHRDYPRAGKHRGDVYDDIVRGAAVKTAEKIESVLFPAAAK